MVVVMLMVTLIVFLLGRASGDPVRIVLGDHYTPEDYESMRHEMGLDQPVVIQFANYVKQIVIDFNMGTSYHSGRPVINEIKLRLPISCTLAVVTLLWAIPLGLLVGIISAIRQYSKLDTVITTTALIVSSIPNFWASLMLMILFSLTLNLLPATGIDTWKGYIMPSMALGFHRVAHFARVTRSSMLETIRSDYVRTARSKGLNERSITFNHELPNASIPVLTMLVSSFEGIISGSAVLEGIFGIPGIGSYLIFSINTGDFPAIQGTVLVLSLIVCVLNFLTDLAYAWIDPRIMAKYKNNGSARKVNREIRRLQKGAA